VRFLVDEMFPPRTCDLLRELGHDAVHVVDLGLNARPDAEVANAAKAADRVLLTENVKDFAGVRDLVIVCALKARLPVEGMSERLAAVLHAWAADNREPYVGLHWPVM